MTFILTNHPYMKTALWITDYVHGYEERLWNNILGYAFAKTEPEAVANLNEFNSLLSVYADNINGAYTPYDIVLKNIKRTILETYPNRYARLVVKDVTRTANKIFIEAEDLEKVF